MSKEKWNDIWKIMKSGQLEFVDKVKNDMLCIICKKVLINAHCGPCGCRYCFECITNYLNGEEKTCPGNTNDCQTEFININQNIFIEQAKNIKISRSIVKCPQKNCDFKDELRNIEDHMGICDSRSAKCPYVIIGCKDYNVVNPDLKKHMLMDIVSHTKLLFEFIHDLKNEIKVLKEDKFEVEKDNKSIKKCIQDFQLKYENEYEEIKVKLKEIENKYDEEQNNSIALEKEIQILKDEIKSMKNDTTENKKLINESKLKCESENRELKEKLKQIENKFTEEQKSIDNSKLKCENENREMKEEIKEIENKCNEAKREGATKIDEINKIITDLKSISKESDKSISKVMNKMTLLQKYQELENCGGEFELRIDKWSEKMEHAKARINERIDSELFYSHRNGYKMRFSVWPNGCDYGYWIGGQWINYDIRGTHLGVECRVMRGEWDDILPWPFKHDVTFELINQHATQIHTSSTVRYGDQYESDSGICYERDNQKPKEINDSNLICFNYKFVSLKELSNDNNRSLIDNDQLFIRCRVNIDYRYIDRY